MTCVVRSPLKVISLFVACALLTQGCLVNVTSRPAAKATSEQPVSSAFTLSSNFSTAAPVGWTTAGGSPISFAVAYKPSLSSTRYSLQCRAGLKTLISAQSYSDCSSGSFAPSATAGRTKSVKNDNGTYTLQVRALSASGSVLDSTSQDFYVHPSLNSVPECSHSVSADDYFAAAAAYLDMSVSFGGQTRISAPFNQVEFTRPMNTWDTVNLRDAVSLRKELIANGDNSLMILRRTRAKWGVGGGYTYHAGARAQIVGGGPSGANLGVYNSAEPLASYQTSDTACTVNAPYFNQGAMTLSAKVVPDGSGGYLDFLDNYYSYRTAARRAASYLAWRQPVSSSDVSDLLGQGSDQTYFWRNSPSIHYKYKAAARNSFNEEWALQVIEARLASNPINANPIDSMLCDAIVFNSVGKGLCFRGGSVANPVQLRAVGTLFISKALKDPTFAGRGWERIGHGRFFRKKLVNDDSNTFWDGYQNANPTDAEQLADSDYRLFMNP